jgi:putative ATP-binding cassette transporter
MDADDAHLHAALEAVGLEHLSERLEEEDNWALRLSGGEQERLAVARALLARPDWLFLDEATASLDPSAEAGLLDAITRHLPNTTVVSITHRPKIAAAAARRLELRRDARAGRLVEA